MKPIFEIYTLFTVVLLIVKNTKISLGFVKNIPAVCSPIFWISGLLVLVHMRVCGRRLLHVTIDQGRVVRKPIKLIQD